MNLKIRPHWYLLRAIPSCIYTKKASIQAKKYIFMQNLHLHVYFLYSIIFTMFYRVPLSYAMLCYFVNIDMLQDCWWRSYLYNYVFYNYMYLFLYFCMYFNLQGTSYLIFIIFFFSPLKMFSADYKDKNPVLHLLWQQV